jgi:hypothetical protein
LAARLGITREVWPEWFEEAYKCKQCQLSADTHDGFGNCFYCNTEPVVATYHCTLPDPASDDPRAAAWEPWLMRALDWRVRVFYWPGCTPEWSADEGHNHLYAATPTAALYAAWLAKEGQPND